MAMNKPKTSDKAGVMMKVLVVVPHHQTAEEIYNLALSHGHQAVFTNTLRDAKKIARSRCFDLTFVHLALPDGNGLELIRQMKNTCPWMPVVALTDVNSRVMELAARQLGVIYYMVGPADPAEIGAILDFLSGKTVNH